MGGDYAPAAVIEGSLDAIKELGINIAFVGDQEKIKAELGKYTYSQDVVEIIHAPEIIGMDEPATASIRTKKKSSISVGVDYLKNENYDAFVSAGNTGAVVAASTVKLGMLEGIERPAIGLIIPTLEKYAFLIDVGANTAPKPSHLLQSGLMAKSYAQYLMNINNPKVGLLNIGEEATKGSDFIKETHKLMSERLVNFIGNVEANDIFSGKCDCIICDGFIGNVVIKVAESVMESAASLLRREIKKSPIALLGAVLMKSRLQHIKKYADYSEYGAAPLLGVNGIVMISHGRSGPKAIKNAILASKREVDHNLMSIMLKEVR